MYRKLSLGVLIRRQVLPTRRNLSTPITIIYIPSAAQFLLGESIWWGIKPEINVLIVAAFYDDQ